MISSTNLDRRYRDVGAPPRLQPAPVVDIATASRKGPRGA